MHALLAGRIVSRVVPFQNTHKLPCNNTSGMSVVLINHPLWIVRFLVSDLISIFQVLELPTYGMSSSRNPAMYDIQRRQTADYVKQNQISELFAHLMQLVVYNKPENPREFLRAEVRKMRDQKASTSLFTEDDFGTMFDLIDVTKQKTISLAQLRNACKNLAAAAGQDGGISEAQEQAIQDAADANGLVGAEQFKQVLSMMLSTKNTWQ